MNENFTQWNGNLCRYPPFYISMAINHHQHRYCARCIGYSTKCNFKNNDHEQVSIISNALEVIQ